LFTYAEQAPGRGIEVIVAGAGGAAHLPGMLAAKTHLPVIGVPIPTENLRGLDSLLSIVQMPKGIPVATVAIGGGENAGLLAAQILAGRYPLIRQRLIEFRAEQTRAAIASSPESSPRRTPR
jgi:5-(carboxyamino)imidazole ribonucleotide mutase